MSASYQAVGWNGQKKAYDLCLVGGVGLYLATFTGVSLVARPDATAETILIRAFGSAALVLLHLILAIGPLCRLDRRFLPLLYNRRHMGVTMFLLALVHGGFSILQFHAFGNLNPFLSLFLSNGSAQGLSTLPFQPLGFIALLILFLMAATSHDFWLTQLTAPVWKTLHMLVYLAYALLIGHVALGSLQVEQHPLPALLLGLGLVLVLGLHLAAAWRARVPTFAGEDWVDVCAVGEVPMDRAIIVCLAGERVAVFRHAEGFSAVSNVCQHQNGPLGEGRIIDGCITCPWHGYQYRPQDGASPAPFTEKVPTFPIEVVAGRVRVKPVPNPPGTYVQPAPAEASHG